MSSKHLTLGSVDPPRTEGLLRVYSMKFCPYAQRVLLVLKAKNLPHEIVNLNLTKKPEWYSKINPKTLVPALIDGDKVIVESLDISDYLDEKYPQTPLYSSDPDVKKREKELIQAAAPAIIQFSKCIYSVEERSIEEWTQLFLEALQPLENEIAARGTTFFGGENPGMVDYMIWPWAERTSCLDIKFGQKLPLKDSDIPLLRKWSKNMFKHPVVQELYISGDRLWKIIQAKRRGEDPKYDEI